MTPCCDNIPALTQNHVSVGPTLGGQLGPTKFSLSVLAELIPTQIFL